MEPFSLCGIVGWPVHQSLSPVIHNYWHRKYNRRAIYRRLPVDPYTDFTEKMIELGNNGFTGVNVTIPWKEKAFQTGTEKSGTAKSVGTANILHFRDSTIFADNSDGFGFAESVRRAGVDVAGGTALLFGAGGAAPAICDGLKSLGVTAVDVTNRTMARAESLKDRFDVIRNILPWTDHFSCAEYNLIVNATSLGMAGQAALVPDFSGCPPGAIAVDIVYTPKVTPFLAAAQDKRLVTIGGLGMLVHQARPAYQLWYGDLPEADEALFDRLEQILERKKLPLVQIGLTGSIGSGKSTVAEIFARAGAAVWDADAAVHALYAQGGAAVGPVSEAFPGTEEDGVINRQVLSRILSEAPAAFSRLEAIVHPLLGESRQRFVEQAITDEKKLALFDIPLLFETQQEHLFDATLTCLADENIRRQRVLSRNGMTEEKFSLVAARQMPDAEKILRADHVLRTDIPLAETENMARDWYRLFLENFAV